MRTWGHLLVLVPLLWVSDCNEIRCLSAEATGPVLGNHNHHHDFLSCLQRLVVASNRTEVRHVFQKFDLLSQMVEPVKDKVDKINDFFTVLYHPNFGGVGHLNPASYFWGKLKEKKEQLVPSAHVAIFGKGQHELHDYPSAYRNSKSFIK